MIVKAILQAILIVTFCLLTLLMTPYVAWQIYEYYWYQGFIPEKIRVTYPVNISGEFGLFGGCGAGIFVLDEISAREITRKGLVFFEDAIYGRKSEDSYYTYKKWETTPVPDSWIGEGLFGYSLSCSKANRNLMKQISHAAKKHGSYYARKPKGYILVIPHLRLVVFSYFS